MGRRDRTKNQKKARANAIHIAQEEFANVPHSFVFNRGQVGQNVQQLITDTRRIMEPFTARTLKVRKKNLLKDFVSVAGPLGVTHFLIFSKSSTNLNFKMARLPRGPTLTFTVRQYSLVKDIVSSLKRHRMHEQQFSHHPLLVLNNFGGDGMHVKLMATMFQNMFPSINVYKVGLNAIKRCVLINYNPATHTVDIRHYSIKVVPVGMSRGMKKLLQERFPNMSKFEDISELLMKGANLSESEAEQDGDHNITELPQVYAGRGNLKAQQSAIRLTEIGPRMTMELVKIEEGMCDGQVMYHSFIQKTEEELQAMLQRKEKRLKLKEERRKKQEGDVHRKREERELHKKKSLDGIKRKKLQAGEADGDSEAEDPCTRETQVPNDQSEADSDREYYRQEVGVEPDEDLFPAASRRKRKRDWSSQSAGKPKRARGSDKAASKQRADPDSQRDDRRKSLPGRKPRLMGTRLTNSRFTGSVLGSKIASKGRRSLGSKGKGQPMGSKGKGRGPGSKGKGQSMGSKGKGQPTGSKSKGRGPGSKGKGQPMGSKGKGRGPGSKGKGQSPGSKGKGQPQRKPRIKRYFNKKCWSNASHGDIQQAILPPLFGVEFVVAFLGNSLAIWLFLGHDKPWHSGITYAFNLAVNDLSYVVTLPLLVAYYSNGKDWMFGGWLCKVERFLFTCNLYGSALFITCISLNRYLGIVHPMFTHNHLRPKHARVASLVTWVLAIAITAPTLAFSEVTMEGNRSECLGTARYEALPQYITYSLFLAAFGCALPFAVTLLCYLAILRAVRGSRGVDGPEKRRVALLAAVVVMLYAMSFVPYTVLRNVNLYRRWHQLDRGQLSPIYTAYQVSKALVSLNTCVHPLLYATLLDNARDMCSACTWQQVSVDSRDGRTDI
uniref:suppressor of SWI4 1 homolog n=1 Tax=Pristiophorus japonicus TaxID=55135 RepID=UPI00398EFE6E